MRRAMFWMLAISLAGLLTAGCGDADNTADSGADTDTDVDTDGDTDTTTDTNTDFAECPRFVDLLSTAESPDGLEWETAFVTVQEGIDAAAEAPQPVCEVPVHELVGLLLHQVARLLDHVGLEVGT